MAPSNSEMDSHKDTKAQRDFCVLVHSISKLPSG
jgi:hypothetical protein